MSGRSQGNNCIIVENGVSKASVVIMDQNESQTREVADLLVHYILQSTGVKLSVLYESEWPNVQSSRQDVRIMIGTSIDGFTDDDANMAKMDQEGFIIHTRNDQIIIAGASPLGTEYGIYEFLERYVGIRWLMPGPFGEEIPRRKSISIPCGIIKQEPAFISRSFSGADPLWCQRNRLQGRLKLGHNLCNLFPPAKYGETHPEFFPEGADLSVEVGWQPCFTAPGIADEAIKTINAYFDEHPHESSYSICTNDNGGFAEARPDHPLNPGRKNSIGEPYMSEIFFQWAKAVAEGVKKKHSNKYLTVYAYSEVYDPPETFDLPDNVVVYITDDRMSWEDAAIGHLGRKLTQRWHKVGPSLGFYEYAYGTPYSVPRVYMQRAAENYRYAHQIGAIGHYAELYANWGEGPKPWVMARLQWNPHQSVDALMEDWCVAAVGEQAALDLVQYYRHWERFWLTRSFESAWYKHYIEAPHRYNYMPFYYATYLFDVTAEDMIYSRKLLNSVKEKAITEAQKQRAELLMQAFEFYEASANSYPRKQVLLPPAETTDALKLLDENLQRVEAYSQRMWLVDKFAGHPVLNHIITPQSWKVFWLPMNVEALSLLCDWCQVNPSASALEQRIRESMQHEMSSVRHMSTLLEEAFIARSSWSAASLAIRTKDGMTGGGNIPIDPGRYGMLCRLFVPDHIAPSAWILLQFMFKDTAGKQLGKVDSVKMPLWQYPGKTIVVPHIAEWTHSLSEPTPGQSALQVEISVHFKDCDPQEMRPELIGFYSLNE